MQLHMYLPDAQEPDSFVVTDEHDTVILKVGRRDNTYYIADPANDAELLHVRSSFLRQSSYIFSDVTGTRGTFRSHNKAGMYRYTMLNDKWEILYLSRTGEGTLFRRGKAMADFCRLPEYECCFQLNLKDTSEIIFCIGALVVIYSALD